MMDKVKTPHPPKSLYTNWRQSCPGLVGLQPVLGKPTVLQTWTLNSLTLDANGWTRNPEAPLSGVECHLQEVQRMGALGKQKVLVHWRHVCILSCYRFSTDELAGKETWWYMHADLIDSTWSLGPRSMSTPLESLSISPWTNLPC